MAAEPPTAAQLWPGAMSLVLMLLFEWRVVAQFIGVLQEAIKDFVHEGLVEYHYDDAGAVNTRPTLSLQLSTGLEEDRCVACCSFVIFAILCYFFDSTLAKIA